MSLLCHVWFCSLNCHQCVINTTLISHFLIIRINSSLLITFINLSLYCHQLVLNMSLYCHHIVNNLTCLIMCIIFQILLLLICHHIVINVSLTCQVWLCALICHYMVILIMFIHLLLLCHVWLSSLFVIIWSSNCH